VLVVIGIHIVPPTNDEFSGTCSLGYHNINPEVFTAMIAQKLSRVHEIWLLFFIFNITAFLMCHSCIGFPISLFFPILSENLPCYFKRGQFHNSLPIGLDQASFLTNFSCLLTTFAVCMYNSADASALKVGQPVFGKL
jgi:hypothetical protein